MYYYELGHYSYDSEGRIVLTHTLKFSKQEFEDKVSEAVIELLLNRRKDNPFLSYFEEGEILDYSVSQVSDFYDEIKSNGDLEKTFKEDGDITKEDFVKKYSKKCFTSFESIYDSVANILCELYGFELLKYEQSLWIEGLKGIVDDNHSGEDKEILDKISLKYWQKKQNS